MILDIIIVILIVYCFFSGRKKGFTVEFFEIFNYLLIIFVINFSYPLVGKVIKTNIRDTRDMLRIYIITFILLYVTFSILLKVSKKFLKTIKLYKGNEIFGGILGLIKSTFIIFIIYIIVLIGSDYSKRLAKQRDDSYIVREITEYGYIYTEIFPQFIKETIDNYRVKSREEKIKKEIIKKFKENNNEKGKENIVK